eukprot:Nk52_evm42s355 gene=Nk52_evmTU42s355
MIFQETKDEESEILEKIKVTLNRLRVYDGEKSFIEFADEHSHIKQILNDLEQTVHSQGFLSEVKPLAIEIFNCVFNVAVQFPELKHTFVLASFLDICWCLLKLFGLERVEELGQVLNSRFKLWLNVTDVEKCTIVIEDYEGLQCEDKEQEDLREIDLFFMKISLTAKLCPERFFEELSCAPEKCFIDIGGFLKKAILAGGSELYKLIRQTPEMVMLQVICMLLERIELAINDDHSATNVKSFPVSILQDWTSLVLEDLPVENIDFAGILEQLRLKWQSMFHKLDDPCEKLRCLETLISLKLDSEKVQRLMTEFLNKGNLIVLCSLASRCMAVGIFDVFIDALKNTTISNNGDLDRSWKCAEQVLYVADDILRGPGKQSVFAEEMDKKSEKAQGLPYGSFNWDLCKLYIACYNHFASNLNCNEIVESLWRQFTRLGCEIFASCSNADKDISDYRAITLMNMGKILSCKQNYTESLVFLNEAHNAASLPMTKFAIYLGQFLNAAAQSNNLLCDEYLDKMLGMIENEEESFSKEQMFVELCKTLTEKESTFSTSKLVRTISKLSPHMRYYSFTEPLVQKLLEKELSEFDSTEPTKSNRSSPETLIQLLTLEHKCVFESAVLKEESEEKGDLALLACLHASHIYSIIRQLSMYPSDRCHRSRDSCPINPLPFPLEVLRELRSMLNVCQPKMEEVPLLPEQTQLKEEVEQQCTALMAAKLVVQFSIVSQSQDDNDSETQLLIDMSKEAILLEKKTKWGSLSDLAFCLWAKALIVSNKTNELTTFIQDVLEEQSPSKHISLIYTLSLMCKDNVRSVSMQCLEWLLEQEEKTSEDLEKIVGLYSDMISLLKVEYHYSDPSELYGLYQRLLSFIETHALAIRNNGSSEMQNDLLQLSTQAWNKGFELYGQVCANFISTL